MGGREPGGRRIHLVSGAFILSVAVGLALLSPARSSAATATPLAPARVEARLSFGHDSNLLDISDLDRESFGRGDEAAFFAVNRLSDQFCEGELGAEWRA